MAIPLFNELSRLPGIRAAPHMLLFCDFDGASRSLIIHRRQRCRPRCGCRLPISLPAAA